MGVLNTTPATVASGGMGTAALWNTEVRDALTALQAAWGTWTPTIGGITLGTGSTTTARYNQVGKTIDFFAQITLGTSGVLTGSATISLPVTAAYINWTGDATAWDSSASSMYVLVGLCNSTTQIAMRSPAASANAALVNTSATVPFTWGVGDILTVIGRYEAA